MFNCWGAVVLLYCCLAVSSVTPSRAQAQTPHAPRKSDDVARNLFQAGKSAYEAGNYEDAVSFFDQAYARSGRPQLLFNIGQAADRLRQDDKALTSFREYLKQVPDAQNRAEVENRIAALERAVAERDAARSAAAKTVVPTPAQTAQAASTPTTNDNAALTRADTTDDPHTHTDTQQPTGKPVTKQWWFWTGIGAVVVGGTVVALAVALGGNKNNGQFYQGSAGSYQGP